jgi:hypothetical protein
MTHIKHLYRGKRKYAYNMAIHVTDKYVPYFESLCRRNNKWIQDTLFYNVFHGTYQFLDKRKINRILSKFNKDNQEDIKLYVSQVYSHSFVTTAWIYKTFSKNKKKY